jgi:hypothetical protein
MKRLVLGWLVLTTSLVGQIEHAPTVAQCQADQRLWLDQIEASRDGTTLPNYDVLDAWGTEMSNCYHVDPDHRFKYYNTEMEIYTAQLLRLQHFLQRHDLWQKFRDEDAAGQR